ncbi:hypothetical protein BDY19DRAFT_187839 [Irpex rosettiformis]|uniref:Uncharacterized protein n=1 Tax=Irpex rosettiformis TaxID=378272 RepID=A0ACB8U1K9_9APHY|nr:hypothetical protein BDY19DRAFT_187839 [Irpex rosettiformis]
MSVEADMNNVCAGTQSRIVVSNRYVSTILKPSLTAKERTLQRQLEEQRSAFVALQRRTDASVGYLNRVFDEPEVEKEKLVEELNTCRRVQEFKQEQERIISLAAQVLSLSLEKQSFLGGFKVVQGKSDQVAHLLEYALASVKETQAEKKSLELQLVDERERTMDALRALAAAENRRLEMTSEVEEQRGMVRMLQAQLPDAGARGSYSDAALRNMAVRNRKSLNDLDVPTVRLDTEKLVIRSEEAQEEEHVSEKLALPSMAKDAPPYVHRSSSPRSTSTGGIVRIRRLAGSTNNLRARSESSSHPSHRSEKTRNVINSRRHTHAHPSTDKPTECAVVSKENST